MDNWVMESCFLPYSFNMFGHGSHVVYIHVYLAPFFELPLDMSKLNRVR